MTSPLPTHTGSYSVRIFSSDNKESTGTVHVQEYNPTERLMRALKLLGMFWGAAIVSICIPLAHFVLVPLFFIGGIVAFLFTYSLKNIVTGGTGTCPACQSDLTIVRMENNWPLTDVCTQCKRHVSIEMALSND